MRKKREKILYIEMSFFVSDEYGPTSTDTQENFVNLFYNVYKV
jgi:hypothetical protein